MSSRKKSILIYLGGIITGIILTFSHREYVTGRKSPNIYNFIHLF